MKQKSEYPGDKIIRESKVGSTELASIRPSIKLHQKYSTHVSVSPVLALLQLSAIAMCQLDKHLFLRVDNDKVDADQWLPFRTDTPKAPINRAHEIGPQAYKVIPSVWAPSNKSMAL